VVLYFLQSRGMNAKVISDLLYKKSGLLGISGISADMRTLEQSDAPGAHEAIDYFVAHLRREIGGMAATLGGLDAVVFCGGIGEHSVRVRKETLLGLGFLGIEVDEVANSESGTVISKASTRVKVMVIPTNEELMIARHVQAFGVPST
jgi:acetate kinase